MHIKQLDNLILVGKCYRGYELKATKSGKDYISFSVFVGNKKGENEDKTPIYISCTVFSDSPFYKTALQIGRGSIVKAHGNYRIIKKEDKVYINLTAEWLEVMNDSNDNTKQTETPSVSPNTKTPPLPSNTMYEVDEDDLPF